MTVYRQPLSSGGLKLARNRMVAMSEEELSAITSDRLVASYGVTTSEANQLIRSFQRRV